MGVNVPRSTKSKPTVGSDQRSFLPTPDYLLALDMSLEHTGYARMDVATGEITKGLVEPKGLKGMARLAFLRDRILVLAEPTHRTLVLIEGYAFGARGQAVVSLGELGGVIRVTLHDREIPYLEVPPTQVKRFVCLKGNAPKQLMLKDMLKRFNEDLDDDNVADALALMYLGRALVGCYEPTNDIQRQVVKDVLSTYWKAVPYAKAS